MRRYLWLISFLLMASPAMADWTGRDNTGGPNTITFKNANDCKSVVCVPIAQPVDSTGASFGVSINPFNVVGSVAITGNLPGFATTPTFNCGTGCSGGGGGSSTITTWGTATLGDATIWGTVPTGNVIGVNANLPAVSGFVSGGPLPGSGVLSGMKDGITGLLSPIIGNAATGQWVHTTTIGGINATNLIVPASTAPLTATSPAMVTMFRPDQLLPAYAATPTFNCGTGCGNSAILTWGGATLGAATAWGTAPTGNVAGVNANLPTVSAALAGTLPTSGILSGMKDGTTGLLSPIIGNAATGQFVNATTIGGTSATGLLVGPSVSPVTATNPAMVVIPRPDAAYKVTQTTSPWVIDTGATGNLISALTAPVAAGTNLIGKVGIDQTTPGTTNGVQLPTSQVPADPCAMATKTNLAISNNSTSSVQLVALSGSTTIYVCSLALISAGANTLSLTTGTGTACATGTAAVLGSTTVANSLSLAANGGLTLGSGSGTVAKGAASGELCMLLGTAAFVSGNLTYVQN